MENFQYSSVSPIRAFLSAISGLVLFLLFFNDGTLLPSPVSLASAAKMASAVECQLRFRGGDIEKLRGAFELSAHEGERSLLLGEAVSWSVYLLKQDTPEKLYNSEKQPIRENRVAFSPLSTGEFEIEIGPYWQDLGTALPNPRQGAYRFHSPVISRSLMQEGNWEKLLRNLRSRTGTTAPRWKISPKTVWGEKVYEETYSFEDGSEFRIEVNWTKDKTQEWGYMVSLEAKPKQGCP